MTHLTAIVLTLNEERHIVECIETLRFADSILIFDSFSTDQTVELAKDAGADVLQRPFDNYAGQRNAALEAVMGKSDWVLFVDADERVTPELANEVRKVISEPAYAGWRIPRKNYIFGRWTRWAGWYPDYQTRLLKVGQSHYDPERIVHEIVVLDGKEGTLDNHFIHYNYEDVAHFLRVQHKYTVAESQILYGQGVRPKPQNYILQPWRHFWWRYVTLKGYRDGLHGLRLSVLMAYYEFLKYVFLGRLWRDKKTG